MSASRPGRSRLGHVVLAAAAATLTVIAAGASGPPLVSAASAPMPTVPAGCLAVQSTVRLDGSPVTLVESTGVYDTQSDVGWFRHELQRDRTTGDPLIVWARHADGVVEVWPTGADGSWPDLSHPSGLATTPAQLASGRVGAEIELARVGRYQPNAAIELLAVASPDPVGETPWPEDSAMRARIDLDAASRAADPALQAAAAAFPVRTLEAHLRPDPEGNRLRSIVIDVALPNGAGGIAQLVTWTVLVIPFPGHTPPADTWQVNC